MAAMCCIEGLCTFSGHVDFSKWKTGIRQCLPSSEGALASFTSIVVFLILKIDSTKCNVDTFS